MIGILRACAIVFLSLFTYDVTDATKKQPHIVLILGDDLGWDDVSFHGSSQIPTPHIDALAASGITLNNYYVQPVCSPTRSAVMTGKYPIHTGMQDGPIKFSDQPYGVPLSERFLPEHLKSLGYSTHAVGKWHIGFFAKQYTPLYRGFDTYMGYYGGFQDYFTHMAGEREKGYDLRRQEEVEWRTGEYNTEIFTSEAESIISTHNTSEPLFLYLAHETPHIPLQAPQDWIDRFNSSIQDVNRRTIAAMISYMDHCVGRVRTALSKAGMLDDTILIFSTDNGGDATRGSASNYPLRGSKGSLWQGGVRGAGVISGGMFKSQSGTISNALMHVSDWLPTLVDAAGGDLTTLSHLDGVSQWKTLVNDQTSSRSEILLNIGDEMGGAALIVGNMKIITGQRGNEAQWYLPAGSSETVDRTIKCGTKPSSSDTCSTDTPCLFDLVADPCEYNNLAADFGRTSGNSTSTTGGNANGADCHFPFKYRGKVYNECTHVAHCQLWCATTKKYRRDRKWGNCVGRGSSPHESTYALMKEKLSKYKEGMVPSAAEPPDANASPSKHGGVWEPWIVL